MKVDVHDMAGKVVEQTELDETVWGIESNISVMHQYLLMQQANARLGTHDTKTRGEVRGGGAKPWRQKRTGRARQGSTRSPQWAGGGVAMGPKPRDYSQKTPKKMVQLALRSALSDRAAEGRIAVVDAWDFSAPKTRDDLSAFKSFRNMPDAHPILDAELNAYDILCSDWVVFTRATLPATSQPAATPEPEPPAASEPPEEPPEEQAEE